MSYHRFGSYIEAKAFADREYANGHYVRIVKHESGYRVLVSYQC